MPAIIRHHATASLTMPFSRQFVCKHRHLIEVVRMRIKIVFEWHQEGW